jgi:hypothetical protein
VDIAVPKRPGAISIIDQGRVYPGAWPLAVVLNGLVQTA